MKSELLAPAGSWESLEAALLAGADAVYLGGNRFGARAYAENLSQERLLEAIDLCHLQNKSLYLTVNTLLKEEELTRDLYDYLAPLYEAGLDGVIIQDFGVLRFLRREFPGLLLHASTQMTIHSAMGAKFLADQGASRIVTSRELSLEEIREIHRQTNVEIEAFVHGALCYSYSGQCLLSSMIGGRSGNRGRCAQPCRLPYSLSDGKEWIAKERYLLSPRDICTLEILPEILEAGVFSLKIEGRMKKPAYTAEVVRIYRKYLDRYQKYGKKNWKVDPKDVSDLMDLYNRGGFSRGYFQARNGREMMSLDCPGHYGTEGALVLQNRKGTLKLKALEDLHRQDVLEDYTLKEDVSGGRVFQLRTDGRQKEGQILRRTRNAALLGEMDSFLNQKMVQEKINGKLIISPQKPAILIVSSRGHKAEVSGDIVQEARTQGLGPDKLRKQMEKTGNTPFCFGNLEITLQEGCFLPVQSINELRRRALEELEQAILASFRRSLPVRPQTERAEAFSYKENGRWELNASVQTEAQLLALLEVPGIHRIYLECDSMFFALSMEECRRLSDLCHLAGKECWLALPRIFRLDTQEEWIRLKTAFVLAEYDGLLIRNIEEFRFLQEQEAGWKGLAADHSIYMLNHEARAFWREQGVESFTASVEQNYRELEATGCEDCELLVYGRLPLMVTAQCLLKTTGRCQKTPGLFSLKDRKGMIFPVRNFCHFCQNTIYNSAPLVLLDSKKEIRRLHPASLRLSFTIEDPAQVRRTAETFEGAFLEDREVTGSEYAEDFTRGHFKRGIE
ncbi:MAG: U32 family peptidase [Candidatus Limivivens sp.]|nr:U32 family peptidase [Candidatus Limivivens sp.]